MRTAAPSAAAPLWCIYFLVNVLRAGYDAGISTEDGAWSPWLALMVLSLWAGMVGRVLALMLERPLARAHGPESLNHQGRGTQWSVGPGGGLAAWGRRALERRGRETFGSL
jgi:hypothetical protein